MPEITWCRSTEEWLAICRNLDLPASVGSLAPLHGQHREEIYSEQEIASFASRRVAVQASAPKA